MRRWILKKGEVENVIVFDVVDDNVRWSKKKKRRTVCLPFYRFHLQIFYEKKYISVNMTVTLLIYLRIEIDWINIE